MFQSVRRKRPPSSPSELHPEPPGLPGGRPEAGPAAGRPPLLQPHPLQGQEEMEGRRGSGQPLIVEYLVYFGRVMRVSRSILNICFRTDIFEILY